MKKSYPIVCPSCSGGGYIANPSPGYVNPAPEKCPACNGTGTVIATEED